MYKLKILVFMILLSCSNQLIAQNFILNSKNLSKAEYISESNYLKIHIVLPKRELNISTSIPLTALVLDNALQKLIIPLKKSSKTKTQAIVDSGVYSVALNKFEQNFLQQSENILVKWVNPFTLNEESFHDFFQNNAESFELLFLVIPKPKLLQWFKDYLNLPIPSRPSALWLKKRLYVEMAYVFLRGEEEFNNKGFRFIHIGQTDLKFAYNELKLEFLKRVNGDIFLSAYTTPFIENTFMAGEINQGQFFNSDDPNIQKGFQWLRKVQLLTPRVLKKINEKEYQALEHSKGNNYKKGLLSGFCLAMAFVLFGAFIINFKSKNI